MLLGQILAGAVANERGSTTPRKKADQIRPNQLFEFGFFALIKEKKQ
jgi:hypothetical protein